jgi:hypothetical protein
MSDVGTALRAFARPTMLQHMADLREHLVAIYAQMAETTQAVFLARVLLHLNVLARGTYAVGDGVCDPTMLRKFNEAQNRIESQLVNLLLSDARRYPDDVFANMLADEFEILGLSSATAMNIINTSRGAASAHSS